MLEEDGGGMLEGEGGGVDKERVVGRGFDAESDNEWGGTIMDTLRARHCAKVALAMRPLTPPAVSNLLSEFSAVVKSPSRCYPKRTGQK